MQAVKRLGFVFDSTGSHPDCENIWAIKEMPVRTAISGLQSFWSPISCYNTFVPGLYNVRGQLKDLTKKDVSWNWLPQFQEASEYLKPMLTSYLLLVNDDSQLTIVVAADTSSSGTGAIIPYSFPEGSKGPHPRPYANASLKEPWAC